MPLLTYGKGYYRMLDMAGPGSVLSVFWIVLITALAVLLGPVVGLI